ncbi:MAG TPA: hypothetical protein VMC81_07975 [Rhodocyclaceae bacterium]|nr:hypothetical protein [Rhodocyclaceae bacterium]
MVLWLIENFEWMALVAGFVAIVWAFAYGRKQRVRQRESEAK